MSSLGDIAQINDAQAKNAAYNTTIQTILDTNNQSGCQEFIDHVVSDAVPLVLSRQLLTTFSQGLKRLPPESQMTVATYALEKIQPRAVSYEEQSAVIREQLASLYAAQEDWSKAARCLAGIDLDSGMRVLDGEYKLGKNVEIAMLYLEDDDAVSAETYIKKASALLSSCKNQELELQYKTCYARILDSKRRFLEAATRYYELSQMGGRVINGHMVQEEDLEQALITSVTCTILAAAGPQRSRMLATLYKDERCAHLEVFPFLEKVYLEHILSPADVDKFSKTLRPHQLALLPDGSTVLDRSVTEHNLEAASKLYHNIHISELAALLGVSVKKAEQAAATMVMENRLKARIDQVDGLITFTASADPLLQWDKNIAGICHAANSIVELAKLEGLPVKTLA